MLHCFAPHDPSAEADTSQAAEALVVAGQALAALPQQRASVVICDLDRCSSEGLIIDVLKAAAALGLVAHDALVFARVQLGRKSSIGANRAAVRRLRASLVKACREARFRKVALHHLMSERAIERTLIMRYPRASGF